MSNTLDNVDTKVDFSSAFRGKFFEDTTIKLLSGFSCATPTDWITKTTTSDDECKVHPKKKKKNKKAMIHIPSSYVSI